MSNPQTSLHHHHHHLPPLISRNREYHKGNWTIQETLILITAKKLSTEHLRTTANLRWNWVENYCWAHGCRHSQNQCNDKWDNLLRDYKKLSTHQQSYWQMDKHQRKLHNLPSNMSQEVFQALNEVVQRRHRNASPQQLTFRPYPPAPVGGSGTHVSGEKSDSNSKRRRVKNISSSIVRSASKLAQTLKRCDEMKEKRHQLFMEIEQHRLQIEETRNEVERQEIANFVEAINNLSDSIHSIISDYN
ncbi:uncharacterized protein LOC116116813 [Pistacia vera]|uniref:uncharacterized protein LOC116116813 n=2 Tax=Pistacia vera TaxID=55513 RepID=UPI001263CC90|nr:uncharacterized protein LOC116116813 [Pistacia vera]